MALWDIQDLGQEAEQSMAASSEKKVVIEGAYHLKLLSMEAATSQKGEGKWIFKWQIIAGATAEQIKESVGLKRTEHFVVEHKKKEVADNYKRDLLFRLKLMGVDLAELKSEGDLFMKAKELTASQPIMCYYLKPQTNDAKYLNWYPKGLVSADGESIVDKEGKTQSKFGDSPTPQATAPQAEAPADNSGLPF